MRRVVFVVVAALVFGVLMPSAALADSRAYNHLHVRISHTNFDCFALYAHRNPVRVHVYGPNYYTSFTVAYVKGHTDYQTVVSNGGRGIPKGDYRVRLEIYEQNGGPKMLERNDYPKFTWATIGKSIATKWFSTFF